MKSTENGVPLPSGDEPPGLYAPDTKDSTEIKAPQLPFGEIVAVATSAIGVQ
jgi:hypothetical protein